MKKLEQIEESKMNFDEQHRLTPEEMGHVKGGSGCICVNGYSIHGYCVCDKNPFGLCVNVGSGKPGTPGVHGDQG